VKTSLSTANRNRKQFISNVSVRNTGTKCARCQKWAATHTVALLLPISLATYCNTQARK